MKKRKKLEIFPAYAQELCVSNNFIIILDEALKVSANIENYNRLINLMKR